MKNVKCQMENDPFCVTIPPGRGEVFCRIRHRLSLIEPTPLQREADAAGECVSSSLRNAKAAVKRRPPTCSHRFNYGFGTARRFSLSPIEVSEPPAVAGGCCFGRRP